jgi:hypothetical protein
VTDNYPQFRLDIEDFIRRQVPEIAAAVQAKVVLQGLVGVVRKSPVDTGRFRGNWQVTQGEPAVGETGREDPTGESTIAAGSASAASLTPYSVAWITNNVPYAQRLEEGWSQQAPQGVVALTLAELRAQFGGGLAL